DRGLRPLAARALHGGRLGRAALRFPESGHCPADRTLRLKAKRSGWAGTEAGSRQLPGLFIAAAIERTTERGPRRRLKARAFFFHPWMTNGLPPSIAR